MAHFDDREWQAGRHAAAGLLTRPTAKLRLRTAWSSHWWAVAARWCHLFIEAHEFRVEFRYSGAGNWIRASDGKQLRRTRSITKEFKQAPASPDSMRILGEDSPFAPFARIGEGAKSPTISGSETRGGRARRRVLPNRTSTGDTRASAGDGSHAHQTLGGQGPLPGASPDVRVELSTARVNEPLSAELFQPGRDVSNLPSGPGFRPRISPWPKRACVSNISLELIRSPSRQSICGCLRRPRF
jgi:hypothetical protein